MAPPSTRRPGFSRKAQYGLFLGYVVSIVGLLFALMLLAYAINNPRGFSALQGVALDVTRPISSAGRSVVNFFGGIGDTIGNYFNAAAQNDDLKRELASSRRKMIEARATELENRRLKALLRLAQQVEEEVVVTRVVGSSFDSSRRLATLAAGRSAGVRPGQPVRSPEGLIGNVIETGQWAARVLLVSDAASNVPVRMVRDGTPAIATGRGDGTIDLKTLEVGKNPFRRGDILVTSGVGGVYPPNVPVAIVLRTQGDNTLARPLADPSTVDFAIVLKPFQPLADQPLTEATSEALQGTPQ